MLGRNDLKGLTILVTGATGGLGRSAVEYLNEQGINVVATGRNETIGKLLIQKGITFIPQDLAQLDEESADQLLKNIDVIWHCAARSSDWGDYGLFYQDNVIATHKLAQYALDRGIEVFVHISTPSIYFAYQSLSLVRESYLPKQFVNAYAKTKYLAEQTLTELREKHPQFKYVALRPRAIYGKYDQVLLPKMQQLFKEHNGQLPLPNGGQAIIDITYVKNVCHAMCLATEKLLNGADQINGRSYNISNGQPIKVADLVYKIFVENLGLACQIKALPYWLLNCVAILSEWKAHLLKQTPKFTRYGMGVLNYDVSLDLTAAKQDLHYSPIYTIDEGIQETFEDNCDGKNSSI